MKKTVKILILSLLTLSLSCNKDKTETKTDFTILNNDYEYQDIKGATIEIDSFAFPTRITLIDSVLIFNDSKSDKPIHLFDYKNQKYIKSFGSRGKGPGEFIGLSNISVAGNKIWAYDITLGKNVSFALDSLLDLTNNGYKYSDEIILLDRGRSSYSPIWINDTTAVSPTMANSDYRLIFSDKNGRITKEDILMFPAPNKDIPSQIHNQSYDGVFKKHPKLDKVIIANRYSDLIELYDLSNNESTRLKTHGDYEPVYTIETSAGFARMAQGDDMRFGYIDASVTNNKIFTLFSGKTRGESNRSYCGSKIVLFDWKGEYLSSYNIEGDALALQAINDKEFYTLEMLDGKVILKKYSI